MIVCVLRCNRDDREWAVYGYDQIVDYSGVPVAWRFAALEIDSA
jgi:hypothetical protein